MADDRFLCAPGLRVEAEARLTEKQVARLDAALARVEGSVDRPEKRPRIAVCGVVAVVVAVESYVMVTP